jgi:hypothetical protein
VWVQFDAGSDQVYLPAAQVLAHRGVPVQVPDEVAGRAPSGDDEGAGLLAQADVWREVALPGAEAEPEAIQAAPGPSGRVVEMTGHMVLTGAADGGVA